MPVKTCKFRAAFCIFSMAFFTIILAGAIKRSQVIMHDNPLHQDSQTAKEPLSYENDSLTSYRLFVVC